MLKAPSAHGGTPAYPFKAGGNRRRQPLAMYLAVVFVAISIAALAVLATQFGTLPSLVASNLAAREEGNVVGSIMLHSPANECRHKTFNNRTGQIAEAGTPCTDVVVDAKGVPVPLGTVRTMDSISKSFR
jgi:hypothetical protein